jgi:structure-specific endonuclease subunit SLX1
MEEINEIIETEVKINFEKEIKSTLEKEKPFEGFVYFLKSTGGSTYIGATINLDHRLRQHNREIVGGAKATSARVFMGEKWERVCYVKNFPDWSACLQFEWRWKQITRKLPPSDKKLKPTDRRLKALNKLLSLDKPTTKAQLYSEWKMFPEVVFEPKQ